MTTTFQRTMFSTERSSEYFIAAELATMTGQPIHQFSAVSLKELLDNVLDACETAGVAPHIRVVVCEEEGQRQIAVGDNGGGIAPETVARILDYSSRTSDKAVYRSVTRGAQGNAAKTLFGMPHALGCSHPVIIDALGLRHEVRAWLDPAGKVRINHDQDEIEPGAGTVVQLTLPVRGQPLDAQQWVRSFALVNPHSTFTLVKIPESADGSQHTHPALHESRDFYQSLVDFPGGWRKPLPGDTTSPWWYDLAVFERLVFAHIGAAQEPDGRDLLLRDFVKQFRGLSANAKAKSVCNQFPDITHLSDFDQHPDQVPLLRLAMRKEAGAPSPDTLGYVGEDQLRQRFAEWYAGVGRHWYRRETGVVDGVAFVFEVLVTETLESGETYTAVNFSPTFGDPFGETPLRSPEFTAYGLRSFLVQAHALPGNTGWDTHAHRNLAVVTHLIRPSLERLDHGKTRLTLPEAMSEAIAGALWRVTKPLYTEEERRRKDAAKQGRREEERVRAQQRPQQQMDLKAAVFAVLPEALDRATGGGQYPVSARSLFYQVRPLIQPLTTKDLNYDYFSQNLLVQYRDKNEPIEGLYYDPRGILYEPHTGKAIPLGTQEVDRYEFPDWRYDKILFVEKKGLWPVLQAAQFAERYDMAVVASEGFATEACRVLFKQASKEQSYQLFSLHDADPAGYNIARTLRAETRRMPGYQVNVVDLGLLLGEALDMGLATEQFTRKTALPAGLELKDLEREYFEGRPSGKKSWICQRVELNAMSAPQLVTYIEGKLAAANVRGKVIPDAAALPYLTEEEYRDRVGREVDRIAAGLLPLDALKEQIADQFREQMTLGDARKWITERFDRNATLPWDQVLAGAIAGRMTNHQEAMEQAVRAELIRLLQAL